MTPSSGASVITAVCKSQFQLARRACALVAAATAMFGTAAAVHYYQLGLTLAHYDARAHLVVARRVFDSLTPGWQQVGAVWLPLPHILNALPVQIDAFYRSGASGVAISIASMALAAWSMARLTSWRPARSPAAWSPPRC